MPYVSELIGKTVTDGEGVRVGRVRDVIASTRENMPHPAVVAILVKTRMGPLFIPYQEIAALIARAIPLRQKLSATKRYTPAASDIFLMRDILDQQIIDVNDVRVVRVNDVELARVNGTFYVANVDTGSAGLLRRLGLPVGKGGGGKTRTDTAQGIISWDAVEPLTTNRRLRLKVPGDRLSELHPADLAEIISDLSKLDGSKFLQSLDPETAAGALEGVEPDFQASLVQGMPDKRVADVLEKMAPDEAADLLAELPEERSQSLLGLMEKEEAADVRKLLTYADDTAGGIMTTEYVTAASTNTAAQTMTALRQSARDAETIFYVYVVDRKGILEGVISLKELVLADPRTKVSTFMHRRVVSVNVRDSQEEVAQVVSRYNLLAVPVIDDEGRMQGIVTVDDALDKIIPTAWKRRLPRLYH